MILYVWAFNGTKQSHMYEASVQWLCQALTRGDELNMNPLTCYIIQHKNSKFRKYSLLKFDEQYALFINKLRIYYVYNWPTMCEPN